MKSVSLEGRIGLNAATHILRRVATRVMSLIWPRFRRNSAMVLLLLIATAFVAAACSSGSQDAAMFDEKGEHMDEDKAAAIKAATTVDSADEAPDFELTLFQNALHNSREKLRMSDLKEFPVIVNFLFPSCHPCRAEMSDLEKVFQNQRKDGVEFVGVELLGLDSAQDGQKFIDKIGVNFALGPDEDGSIVRAYKVRGFPTTVFIDRNLRIFSKWTGPLDDEKLEEFVQELLR